MQGGREGIGREASRLQRGTKPGRVLIHGRKGNGATGRGLVLIACGGKRLMLLVLLVCFVTFHVVINVVVFSAGIVVVAFTVIARRDVFEY